jgi:hypothetical protein
MWVMQRISQPWCKLEESKNWKTKKRLSRKDNTNERLLLMFAEKNRLRWSGSHEGYLDFVKSKKKHLPQNPELIRSFESGTHA